MNAISLASGVLPEFGPLDIIAATAAAGFDAVGLWVEPDSWTPEMTRDCRAAIADAGLALLDAEVVWLKPDASLDQHRRSVDIAIELGAANLLCVSSIADAGATAAQLAALCRHAEGTPLRIAMEFGIFTAVRSLGAALAILDAVAHPARALLVDPIHVDRAGNTPAEIAAVPRALLPYAQFCDAPAARPDPTDFAAVLTDALDLREQCGAGALPLAALLAALPADLPLSIELRSKTLREAFPDATARAKAVAAATRGWLEAK